jgi:kynureninase
VKAHFSRFLSAGRLHVAAHSHHPWPDVTFAAQQQAWLDAAARHDDKWDHVFGEVLPQAQRHVARILGLPDPGTLAFAPNTHQFVVRLLSCLPPRPRVLTTDAEFLSFTRQIHRLEEDALVAVDRIAVEPFATFPDRFAAAAAAGGHDLVFVSHVMFDSGYVVPDLTALVAAVPDDGTFVVVDGYHGFMALPTDLAAFAHRVFYTAGGYKYAMAGEGVAFLHCPPGYGPRPRDTGWYAGFGHLEENPGDAVPYAEDGSRFLGATFDPSGLYRFNAVQDWLADVGLDVAAIHGHVRRLQEDFLTRLADTPTPLRPADLVPGPDAPERGHFLTFRTDRAAALDAALQERGVTVDHRRDRLRLGFGIYHDEHDLEILLDRLCMLT